MKKIHKNIIFTAGIFQILFILILLIPFLISFLVPGDPVIAYLPDFYTTPEYEAMEQTLGFNNKYPFQLGYQIYEAYVYGFNALWALFLPGHFLFILILGFFLIYIALQKSPKNF